MNREKLSKLIVDRGLSENDAAVLIVRFFELFEGQKPVRVGQVVDFFVSQSLANPNKTRLTKRLMLDHRILADRKTKDLRIRAGSAPQVDRELEIAGAASASKQVDAVPEGHSSIVRCDVFVSYSRKDEEAAQRLRAVLTTLGMSVRWDRDLPTGETFRVWIRKQLKESTSVVVLWSEHSIQSEFVADEAEYARKLGTYCPVRLDGCDLPLGFGERHTDDLRAWSGEVGHIGFARLLQTLVVRKSRSAA